MLLVFRWHYAGTNQATAATWAIGGEFDSVMDDLRSRGVSFEHYDLPETTREGDVHFLGDTRGAWFKDPDGNILALVNQPSGPRVSPASCSTIAERQRRLGERMEAEGVDVLFLAPSADLEYLTGVERPDPELR